MGLLWSQHEMAKWDWGCGRLVWARGIVDAKWVGIAPAQKRLNGIGVVVGWFGPKASLMPNWLVVVLVLVQQWPKWVDGLVA